MFGPPLAKQFLVDGTPGKVSNRDAANTLNREVVQELRKFQPIQIGTHSKVAARHNIPRNSGEGLGVGGNQFVDADNAEPSE